jgi:hypothetical protein
MHSVAIACLESLAIIRKTHQPSVLLSMTRDNDVLPFTMPEPSLPENNLTNMVETPINSRRIERIGNPHNPV